MANIMSVLKSEISRIARKEARAATAPLRKPKGATRSTLADLKRRVAALEKENKRMAALLSKLPQPEPKVEPAKAKGWISGKGVRSLRQKLGLSQGAFAKLLGVGPHTIYKWESKPGMLRLRGKTRPALMAARQLGAREAKAKLAEMAAAKKAKPARKAKK
jgi:DNA-binding transcriptional regulator YiaG